MFNQGLFLGNIPEDLPPHNALVPAKELYFENVCNALRARNFLISYLDL